MSAVRGRGKEAGMQGTQIAGGRDRTRVGKNQRKEKHLRAELHLAVSGPSWLCPAHTFGLRSGSSTR